ncbi:MAG TPA: hypothetical protein ENI11_02885 [Actinobacteria bacterium]|nr:hypothetical protein [Actinomycetota bacterium]
MVDETENAGNEEQEDTEGIENKEETVLTEKTETEATEKAEAEVKETAEKAEAGKSKDAEDGDKDEGAPAEYADFTVPEDMDVDQAALEAFLPVAKEANLTQAEAQKFVDVQSGLVQKHAEAQMEAWANTQQEWRDEVKADSEVGGDAMDEKVTGAKRALDKVGTPKLRALLDATGTGNHVEFIRFFARVDSIIGNDTFNFGGTAGSEPIDPAKILFPNEN